jgi:hypothetical protein
MIDRHQDGIMNGATCRWVCERLPLFVEERDDLSADQGSLGAEACERIGRHLAACEDCRARESALAEVVSVLGAVAGDVPAEAGVGSLLPGVSEQIRWHEEQSRSAWARLWRVLGISGLLGVRPRPLRAYASLRCERPLQLAWLRDSLRERLAEPLALVRMAPAACRRDMRPPAFRLDLGAGLAIAGMLLFAFVLAGSVHQRRFQAQSQIAANAAPIPGMGMGMGVPRMDAAPVPDLLAAETMTRTEDNRADEPIQTPRAAQPEPLAVALASAPAAHAGSSPVFKPAGIAAPPGTAAPAATPSAVASSAGSSPAPRYDFDLEHGTPMPPETRGGKPAY